MWQFIQPWNNRKSYVGILKFNMNFIYLTFRESIRPRAMCGLSRLLSGKFWTSGDASLTSISPTKKWCRACDNCITPPSATTLIPKMVARRILEMSLIIYRDPPPPPRISTIWCSNAGGERRTRGRLSVKYRSFCSGKILDTLQHPDIEPQTWTSATFLIIIPRIRTSSVLKRVDERAGNVLIWRIARSERRVNESD